MKIKITDKYYLTSDAHNIILNELSIVESGENRGKEHLKAIGFYPSIVQAFDGLLRLKGMRSKARTLEGLVREHNDFLDTIRQLFPTVQKSLDNEAQPHP